MSAATAQETESVPNEDHKRTARCNAASSSVVRKRMAPPNVDHRHTGKHSAAPPKGKVPVRGAASSEGKRPTVAREATQPVEVMRLVSAGQTLRRDTPHVRGQGSANADPQQHKAIAALATPGR